MQSLLRKAAKEFDRSSNPFSTEWLSKNQVSAGECIDLSQWIGMAILVMVREIKVREIREHDEKKKRKEYNPSKRS